MNKRYVLLGTMFLVINVLLLLPTPLITMYLIDTIIPSKNIEQAIILLLVLLLILGAKSITEVFQSFYFSKYNNLVILSIQKTLLDCIQCMPRSKRKKLHTGYIMSRIIDDPSNLDGMLARSVVSLIKDILIFTFGFIILCYLNVYLFLISIVIVPIYYISLKHYAGIIHQSSGKYYEAQAVLSKKMQESISMLDTFTINVATKQDQINVVRRISDKIRAYMYREIESLKSMSISGFISGTGPVLVVCIGAIIVIMGKLTLGELVAFNTYLGLLYGPTSRFINSYVSIQKSISAWDRIYGILYQKEKHEEQLLKHNISGDINIKNLCVFADDVQILKHINLEIGKGQTVAFVGKSGAGKSTLTRVILSLEDVFSGEVLFDGLSINQISKDYLRRQIGLIEQEPQMISASIFENIILGNGNATEKNVIDACKVAGIHDFIMNLEKGYETIVDEKGINFSIGQKQRIAIARAIVKKPKIIILDESTSNLDSENESAFFEKLNDSFPNITKIVIAHNLSVTQNSDLIYVLDNGEIVNKGKHEELVLMKNSVYYSLWQSMYTHGKVKADFTVAKY